MCPLQENYICRPSAVSNKIESYKLYHAYLNRCAQWQEQTYTKAKCTKYKNTDGKETQNEKICLESDEKMEKQRDIV
jgi:hypothetical protein